MKLSTKRKFLLCVAGITPLGAANIINIDATGLTAQTGIASIGNTGTAGGTFDTVAGSVDVAPAGGINGLVFDGSKMNSSFLTNSLATPMTGNQAHSAQAWVFNPAFGNEEAIVAWGRRGGGTGSNVGFHQGTHGTFGAVGHWGGPDVTYNNPEADATAINATASLWTHLAYTFDGNESRVFIDGVFVNADAHGALNTHEFLSDGTTPLPFALGAEHNGGDITGTPIAFSGTIGRVRVDDTALSDSDILSQYNSEKAFFTGVPEPSSALLSGFAACLLMTRRRRS